MKGYKKLKADVPFVELIFEDGKSFIGPTEILRKALDEYWEKQTNLGLTSESERRRDKSL